MFQLRLFQHDVLLDYQKKIKANVSEHLRHIDISTQSILLTEVSGVTSDTLSSDVSIDIGGQHIASSTSSLPQAGDGSTSHTSSDQLAGNLAAELYAFESENVEMTDDQNSSTDNSDMDTESDADDNDSVFQNRLAEWASKFQISHSAIAHLLSILQDSHTNLPKDPRTLLQTKRDYELRTIEGGSYYHFDMKLSISDALAAVDLPGPVRADLKIIYVQINIDGLPLFKSSNVQFWPILGRIDNPIQGEPFIIGLFCGRSKPVHVEEYLRDFITEMQALENDGFQFEGFNHQLHVKISCFICDAPATAFIKQIKGHSGYYGCGSCVQSGVWQGKITFPLVDSPLRTDVQFDEMVNEEHHIGSSPLKNLSIGMVSQFPLDYMHLVLGCPRKNNFLKC